MHPRSEWLRKVISDPEFKIGSPPYTFNGGDIRSGDTLSIIEPFFSIEEARTLRKRLSESVEIVYRLKPIVSTSP